MTPSAPPSPLTIASNRLPVRLRRNDDGGWEARASAGGLVSALKALLAEQGGTWVGWSGTTDLPTRELRGFLRSHEGAYDLEPVALDGRDREGYYLGYSNRVLWPLLHGMSEYVEPRNGDWRAYQRVNATFTAVLQSCGSGPVWIHDYHLMLVGDGLRSAGCRRPIGYFLHTPFPTPDALDDLPAARSLIRALSRYDCIGFQTEQDRRNFIDAAAAMEEGPRHRGTAHRNGDGARSLEARTRALPISIDALYWSRRSTEPETARRAAEIRAELGARVLILGVDRLDYTKGLEGKVEAFAQALSRHPSLRERVTLRQLAIPTRGEIPVYARLRRRVQAKVEEVNRTFGTADWIPVDYICGHWDSGELVAQYRAADVALVTPLRDGMNLVAKEYCAAKAAESGTLVLSTTAGSALQLHEGALLVDPRDIDGVANGIYQAISMDPAERQRRMAALRRAVRREDLRAWTRDVLESLEDARSHERWQPSSPPDRMTHPRRLREVLFRLMSTGHGAW